MDIFRSRWMKSRARRKNIRASMSTWQEKLTRKTLVMNFLFPLFSFLCVRVTLDFEAGWNIIRLEGASAVTRFTGLVIIADRIIKCQKICECTAIRACRDVNSICVPRPNHNYSWKKELILRGFSDNRASHEFSRGFLRELRIIIAY